MEHGGRVLVPLRDVIANLKDFAVTWDPQKAVVTAAYGDRVVRLKMGSHTASVNGMTVELDTPPATVGGRTMVPLRFLSEALGATVTWDTNARTVAINTLGPVDMSPRGGFLSNGVGNTVNNANQAEGSTPRFYRTPAQRDVYMSYLMLQDYDLYLKDPEAWKRRIQEYLQRQSNTNPRAGMSVGGVQEQYFSDLEKALRGSGKTGNPKVPTTGY
jgi:hypothetical protein